MARYTIDPETSRCGFSAKAMGLIPTPGRMKLKRGSVVLDGDTIDAEGVVDATTVKTYLPPRDWHLRHRHYLNAKEYPEITLKVDGARKDADTIAAALTVRGATVEVPLRIEQFEAGDELVVKARGTFDRTPIGMLPPAAGVPRKVELRLDLRGRRVSG